MTLKKDEKRETITSMKNFVLVLAIVSAACRGVPESSHTPSSSDSSGADVQKWEQRAKNVTIIRDTWGIPHIYSQTDADTVFGLMYAQAEDDFNRVEVNYLNGMGRLAEAEGESEIYRDLRMKLFIDPEDLKRQYQESPEWLKRLMDAYADGLNYYLHTHPDVEPKVITHFEPWMALSFSEGSIGGDIERVSLAELQAFYGDDPAMQLAGREEFKADDEPTGSNGFAIAPSNSATGHALLYINPHTSFFFRAEVHMVSEEGLNTYGAVTWGQFFVYQGFNERAGWMHTSSRADAIDEYLEEIVKRDDGLYYRYGDEERPLETTTLTVRYKIGNRMAEKEFTVYRSHHGPIIREQDGKWVSIRLMEEPVKAITQSFLRTKANGHEEFYETMEFLTNSSNNTVYADADGNIAYYHGNFIPRRDLRFDWNRPVDGSDPATEWQGLHSVEETITLLNPANGWIQNTNNWPFSAAGPESPKKEDYPIYMSNNSENFRGLHAVALLENKTDFTLDSLIAAGYDSYLTGFEKLLPSLIEAYDEISADEDDPLKSELKEQIDSLRAWDLRWSETSTETSLAIYWGSELMRRVREDPQWQRVSSGRRDPGIYDYMAGEKAARHRLEALSAASKTLQSDFGDWRTAWGEINRYQRLTGDIVQKFNDDEPSLPVGFASGRWGALASFGARTYPGTKRMYGTGGNSFIAAVEFGERLKAKAVTVGGLSSDPDSPHFDDQAMMYAQGQFRDVLFYREDVEQHLEREYHPGQ
ncbi:MAG: penicillin acylase family protein [Acidobacteriota bacterium]|nr:MAG: penicillin acylase family protein [Acidobacteriota bacterium]